MTSMIEENLGEIWTQIYKLSGFIRMKAGHRNVSVFFILSEKPQVRSMFQFRRLYWSALLMFFKSAQSMGIAIPAFRFARSEYGHTDVWA